MKKIYFIIFAFLCFSINYAQNIFYSNGDNLNIREFPDQNSTVMGKLSKGEKVEVLEISQDWAKIQYQNNQYYVSAKFLADKKPEETKSEKIGFQLGFGYSYLFSAGLFLVIMMLPEVIKRQTNDRRFKSGMRQDKVPEWVVWKLFLKAGLYGLPFGLIGGIICWIISFFG